MGQVGLHCIRGDMPHDACRACALNPLHPCMYTPDLLEKLRREPYEGEPKFSPSRILSCQRKEMLAREVPYYTDIDDSYPLTRGNMVHALMEDARYPGALGVLREQQLWTTVDTRFGPQRFEGKVDLIVIKALNHNVRDVEPGQPEHWYTAKVTDYKTKGEVGHDLVKAYPNYIAQVNIYRWLVERELRINDCPMVVDELEIEYAGMNKPRRFTSAGPLKTKGKMLTRSPRTYAELELAPIPLWPLEQVEAAVVRRIEMRLEHEQNGTLPDVLPEAEQWQCLRCPLNKECWERWEAM